MDHFHFQDGRLFCEQVDLEKLADHVGTPTYVYSRATLEDHYDRLAEAFAPLEPVICYAVKSCDNLSILALLTHRGAGMDVVSGGEILRARAAGADMSKVVYAGVGKTDDEIDLALDEKIGYFNIESEAEFDNIADIARRKGVTARAALRINPDVDPRTAHAKTTTGRKESKFGVDIERARRFFAARGGDEHLKLCAVHMHIGSPVYQVEPYVHATKRMLTLVEQLQGEGHHIEAIDIGGGFGADYQTDQTPAYADYARQIVPLLKPFKDGGGQVFIEPGRTISANAGILLTRVLYIKEGGSKTFAIVDTGMHHLLRPTLYEAFHFIWPAKVEPAMAPPSRGELDMPGLTKVDVVGPICETGDYLALGRKLPPLKRGDLLAVFAAGAYGRVMASNYNSMPRPAEVLIHGDEANLVRRRETWDELLAPETNPHPVLLGS